MNVIELKNVSFKYPLSKEKILEDVSFTIQKGEFVALIGKNGAGKTTLCNIIRGLIPHFHGGKLKGDVLVDGTNLQEMTLGEIALKVGFIFQNPFIQASGVKKTVFEEVLFGLENLGVSREEMIERTQAILKQLKIEYLQDKNPTQLSGGQRQRVALASVLVMEPDILIIDEPTSQLDPQGTEEVFETIQLMKEKGKTIILVEHKIDLIAEYADRVILLNDKKVIFDGAASEVLTNMDVVKHGTTLPQVALLGHKYQSASKQSLPQIPITLEEGRQVFQAAMQEA